MSKQQAQGKKTEGNNFFKAKKYPEAIEKYTDAIALDPSDVTFYSNRSACYAAISRWAEAAEDGRQCVITDKTFVKGYFRAALALQNLDRLDDALDFIKRGLGIESSNPDLKKMSKEIEETQRLRRVAAAIEQADVQDREGKFGDAIKTIEGGLRLDPDNANLTRLLDRVKPKFERSEKQRVSQLDPKEKLKEEGDRLFKEAKFEDAIKVYTRCLAGIPNKSSELALKVFANRAACYKQLSNFDGTIEDCTAVLEHKPDDVKSLMRRAQAYEACERYKLAQQDVRQVLAMNVDVVGKSSYDLANGMQHRLNRVIAQLRA